MKITRVESFMVAPRWTFLKVHTDEGITGIGEAVRLCLAEGFRVMKTAPFAQLQVVDSHTKIDAALEQVAAVRQTAGSNVDLMLDFHGRVSPAIGILAEEAFRPFHPFWIEGPCLPEKAP